MLNSGKNNKITASRQGCYLRCQRQHYYQFELGLRREETSLALAVGSAWHRGMEARWKGATYEEALQLVIPEDLRLDKYSVATVCALLAGYYAYYGERETLANLEPEIPFCYDYRMDTDWEVAGKIDGIGSKLERAQKVLIEAKTTGESIDVNSPYWMRLRFNSQLYQYFLAAKELGIEIDEVIYDVVRKPSIRPRKSITDLDADGLKIVLDSSGQRVLNAKGKDAGKPRQSADSKRGWYLSTHKESDEEYYLRLFNDTQARPEFYFSRREVPIIDGDVEEFSRQRYAIVMMIEMNRSMEKAMLYPESAWPRAISKHTCNFCAYSSFCLSNIHLDLDSLPNGFEIKPFNPELENEQDTSAFEVDDTDDAASTGSAV